MNYTLQKGTKWVTQYQRLSKPSKGISAKYMRCLFISIAIPKMLYAADLFLISETKKSRGSKGFIGKLGKVQRQASLCITGILKSAPTDDVDACMDLLLFHLLVKKLLLQATTRLATLPWSHPMYKHANRAALRYIKSHRAPSHEVLHAFNIQPSAFESIHPYHHSLKLHPWFLPPTLWPTKKRQYPQQANYSNILQYSQTDQARRGK